MRLEDAGTNPEDFSPGYRDLPDRRNHSGGPIVNTIEVVERSTIPLDRSIWLNLLIDRPDPSG